MGWWIECDNKCSLGGAWANQIEELLREHRDDEGRFLCRCGAPGHIKKEYQVKGRGEVGPWRPHLVGAVQPDWAEADPDEAYQPFLFLTREPGTRDYGVWCRYFKRLENGNLKFGDGPGAGPAFGTDDLLNMLRKLIDIGILDKEQVQTVLSKR